MNHKTVLKLSPIAASLMIALSSSVAYAAAAPAAGVLPGAFNTNVTGATYVTQGTNSAGIDLGTAVTAPVIQFGGSTTAVPTTVAAPSGITTAAGFNIGSGATLNVTAGGALLVSDLTGQASQIYGNLNVNQAVFIANPNGVVVGGSGSVSAAAGGVALLGYAQDPSTFNGTVSVNTATVTNKGDVTVAKGANFNNAGYLLVAGAGNVNVDATALNTATTNGIGVAAGVGATAGATASVNQTAAYTTTAVVNLSGTGNLSGAQFGAAGAVNVAAGANVTLGNATTAIGGTLTNSGTLNLGSVGTIGGALVNANTLTTTLGTVAALGGIINSGVFSNANAMTLATGTAAPAAISNSGQLSAAGLTVGSAASFTNTGVIYVGTAGLTVGAGSINLGGVVGNSSAGGSIGALSLTASKTDITLGAKINSSSAASLSAAKGSIYINNALTATGGVTAAAANQIMVNGAVNASAGNVSLTTTNTWTGPYSLGVVVQPSGSITATGAVGITVDNANNVGNMLQYGNISAGGAGFTYTGNSYYQGAGAQIKGSATFNFGGVITGGIANGGQSSDPFKNAVVVNGGGTGSTVALAPTNLGVSNQNVNIMGVGNTTIAATLPATAPAIASGATAVINPNFVSSNFFARAQGGTLELNNGTGTTSFYWPGLIYASTVQAGKLATVDTTQQITVGGNTTNPISNAVPMNVAGGMGVYLMSGKVPVNVTTNTNSNINVLNPTLSGVMGNTAAAPVGNTITFNRPLPAANLVAYTPPAE